jgi:hypothetical protein
LKRAALIERATESYGKLDIMANKRLVEQGIDTLDKYIDFYIN